MKPEKETKEERFRRLANARVNKILAMLRLLGNLSQPGNYAYSKEQVEQIFSRLQMALIQANTRFIQPEKHQRKRFSLSKPYETRIESQEFHPAIGIRLPDGSYLRAVGYQNSDYPAINIYWDNGINDPSYPVCFVEFNAGKADGQQVCIGAYCDSEEDTKYYAPYNLVERNKVNAENE